MKVMSLELSVGLPLPLRSTLTGPNPWYLYLMKSSGCTKIGISHDPHKRRKQLSRVWPEWRRDDTPRLLWYCEIADRATETEWHERFDDQRVGGEWFNLSLGDISEIAFATAWALEKLGSLEAAEVDDHFKEWKFDE